MTSEERSSSESGWWTQAGPLPRVAVFLVIAAAAWYMLKELAPLLRPLLLAILLCYVIVPLHAFVHRGRSELQTVILLTIGALILGTGFGILIYGSTVEMSDEMPRLSKQALRLSDELQGWSNGHLPSWMSKMTDDAFRAEARGVEQLQSLGKKSLNYAADMLLEALVVGLYVVFLLIEARQLPNRVKGGFDGEKAQSILATVQVINSGIANYLKAKVKSSLILAVPVTAILFFFGIKFAAIWGLLTFVCNFVPYVGTVVACGTPIIFGFLDLPLGWQPATLAILLVTCHGLSASFVEPTLIGNAVGLSPLVILVSLTFWGLCWGLVGMFLAVPLTVATKIILANLEPTRGIAGLLGDD